MGLLGNLLGKKHPAAAPVPVPPTPAPAADAPQRPEMIRVVDGYGRDLYITRQQWRETILLPGLEKSRTDPNQLGDLITGALRCADRHCLGDLQAEATPETLGTTIATLAERLLDLLAKEEIVRRVQPPEWYQVPAGEELSGYLQRLEQQLALTAANMDFLAGDGVYGEREMLDGLLQLCVNNPANPLPRMLLAQTLRLLQKVRPVVLPEFSRNIAALQRDHPIGGPAGKLIQDAIGQVVR